MGAYIPPPPLTDAVISGEEYGDVLLSLFEKTGIGLAVLDPALRVRAVNDVFSEQCGRPRAVIRNHSFAELLHLSVRQHLLRQFELLVQGDHTRVACQPLATRFENTGIVGQLAAFPVDDSAGKMQSIVVQFAPERTDEALPLARGQVKLTGLTSRVLEGVAAGDPTVRLAAKLFLSRQGIEYHVSLLLRQFKVPNRTALAAKAYSMGIFSIGCWPPKVLPECIRN
ncbi:PAS domain-containing protein [Streptomyces diacarni]|uniref:LuxR family transcriptional regulator n=1 Tax=Streptomyces diacarni TaxID=2800381 RepID=A0A367EFC4_9ACTN|nr:PAS domain-containing protein [Streptomyces diacarni]RCG16786.1 LuxR family transcriptional regulator [Streptomyces diacarni]